MQRRAHTTKVQNVCKNSKNNRIVARKLKVSVGLEMIGSKMPLETQRSYSLINRIRVNRKREVRLEDPILVPLLVLNVFDESEVAVDDDDDGNSAQKACSDSSYSSNGIKECCSSQNAHKRKILLEDPIPVRQR